MNFKKLGIVIQREYLNKVKKKSFLLITFLAPVFFAAICILPSLIMVGAKEEAKQVGVIDRSGIVLPYLTDNDVTKFVDLGADASPEAIKADFSSAGVPRGGRHGQDAHARPPRRLSRRKRDSGGQDTSSHIHQPRREGDARPRLAGRWA